MSADTILSAMRDVRRTMREGERRKNDPEYAKLVDSAYKKYGEEINRTNSRINELEMKYISAPLGEVYGMIGGPIVGGIIGGIGGYFSDYSTMAVAEVGAIFGLLAGVVGGAIAGNEIANAKIKREKSKLNKILEEEFGLTLE